MRENMGLYRGKRKDNGEWVEGGYIPLDVDSGYTYIIEPCNYASSLPVLDLIKLHSILVIPKTIGQFTGLTDKNGVRIFEGDIVRYAERRLGGEDVSVAFPVTFDEGGFCAHHYFLNNWLRNGLGGNTKLEDIEVIGNIHDNPELLQKI